MKQVISICIFLILAGCGQTDQQKSASEKSSPLKTDTATKQTTEPVKTDTTVTETETKPMPLTACNKLIYFVPGATIEAVTINKKGEVMSREKTKVLNVSAKNGRAIANAESTVTPTAENTSPTTATYAYTCDGNNMYYDIGTLFSKSMKNKNVKFKASAISFPLAVKEGAKLPDARGEIKADNAEMKMNMTYVYNNRKVEARETITINNKTWNCYRISSAVKVEVDMPGMDENTKKFMELMQNKMNMTTMIWFDPSFGIVRTEVKMNGELMMRNEVVEVER